ncbi:MAG TPA: TonB family protein [Terriglobales bacterium]|jgi:protein TonB
MDSGEIFFEHDRWGKNLAWSAALHAGFTLFVIVYGWIASGGHGSNWGAGGGGSAMGVTLVANIPLPANPVETKSVLATESKGLAQSKAQEKTEEPDAVPIPEKNVKIKPKPPQPTATQRKPQPQPVEQAQNQIPYGEGGQVSTHYSMFSAAGANGGIAVTGGGGDFGSRYAYYVQAMTRKVSENWLKYEVDPRIQSANRVYITFDIDRSGRPSHIQVEQSSNVPSLDTSAVRALQRIDTFGPLPSDYPGNHVSVEYWFDYKR